MSLLHYFGDVAYFAKIESGRMICSEHSPFGGIFHTLLLLATVSLDIKLEMPALSTSEVRYRSENFSGFRDCSRHSHAQASTYYGLSILSCTDSVAC